MRFTVVLAGLLAAAPCVQAFAENISPPTISPSRSETTQETIRRGLALLEGNELHAPAAAAALDTAIRSPDFASIPEEQRYLALLATGQLAEKAGDHKAAYPLLVRASESSVAEAPAWLTRLSAAYFLNDFMDSARCIGTIAKRWPKTLDQINDGAVYDVNSALGDDKPGTQMEQDMLESLFDAKWNDSDGEPNWLWRDLTQLLLAQGDVRKATAVAERIQSARVALSMRVDKRFDRITRKNTRNYDIDRVAAKELAAVRLKAIVTPSKLRPVMLLQALLLDNLQYEQALAIGDDIIAKSRDGLGASQYSDFNQQYIWILDQRARALQRLGRWDEAIRQMEQAARRPENGEMNVSQIINLGDLYASLGKTTEALDTLSELGTTSPYGRMQQEMAQLLAAIQKEDKPSITKHLAFMREHRENAMSTWGRALLLSGDTDAAVDLLVERLKNRYWRSQALVDVQQYADVTETPLDAELRKKWRAIVALPKVRTELDKVGRIEHFNLEASQN